MTDPASLISCARDCLRRAEGSLENREYAAGQVSKAIDYLTRAMHPLKAPGLAAAREQGPRDTPSA